MDIDFLDTATPAEEGRFCHFKHPALGHFLYTGAGANPDGSKQEGAEPQAIGAVVRGWHSDSVQAVIRKHAKAQLENGKDSFDEEASGRELARALIVEFRGLEDGDNPLKADKAGIDKLFKKAPQFQGQVLAFAKNSSRFFTKPPSD